MKKFVIVLLAVFVCFKTNAQDEETVRGKYKDGYEVTIKYIPGDPDVITSIKYPLVSELKQQVDNLKKQIKQLTPDPGRVSELQKQIILLKKQLNNQALDSVKVKELEKQIYNLQTQLSNRNANSGKAIELDNQIMALNKRINTIEDSLKISFEKNDSLHNEIENKKKEAANYEKQNNKLLADQKLLNESLKRAYDQIEDLKPYKEPRTEDVKKSAPSISFSYGMGVPILFSSLIENKIWEKEHTLSQYGGNIIVEFPIKPSLPFSFGIGLGTTYYKLFAHFSSFVETVYDQTDIDNKKYNAICLYNGVREEVSLLYAEMPLFISYGRPRSHRISGYCKIVITPSYNIQKTFQGEGSYNISGYYPEWNVKLHDIAELNFNSNGRCYEKVDFNINEFVLWGSIAGGIYIPISNLKENNRSAFILKIGVKCDYSLTTISNELNEIFIKGATYRIYQSNILAGKGTRILSPGFDIGLVYMFSKHNK
jgi:hypothetical protein